MGSPEQPLKIATQLYRSLCQPDVLRALSTGVGAPWVGVGLAGLGLLLRGDALWTGLAAAGAQRPVPDSIEAMREQRREQSPRC